MNVSRNQLCDYSPFQSGDNLVLDIQDVTSSESPEPVTLEEAKLYCRIDFNTEDALITSMIQTARLKLEKYTGLSFKPKMLKVLLNNGMGGIDLPYGPITGDVAVLDSDDQLVASATTKGFDYKTLETPADNGLTVSYQCGFAVLPETLKTAIKAQVLYMYEHRGDEIEPNLSDICPDAKQLCKLYRRVFNEFFL